MVTETIGIRSALYGPTADTRTKGQQKLGSWSILTMPLLAAFSQNEEVYREVML